MSFLSNFNILEGILLGPTDLTESNEDMTFSISVLSVMIEKRGDLIFIFKKIRKMFICKGNVKFSFISS